MVYSSNKSISTAGSTSPPSSVDSEALAIQQQPMVAYPAGSLRNLLQKCRSKGTLDSSFIYPKIHRSFEEGIALLMAGVLAELRKRRGFSTRQRRNVVLPHTDPFLGRRRILSQDLKTPNPTVGAPSNSTAENSTKSTVKNVTSNDVRQENIERLIKTDRPQISTRQLPLIPDTRLSSRGGLISRRFGCTALRRAVSMPVSFERYINRRVILRPYKRAGPRDLPPHTTAKLVVNSEEGICSDAHHHHRNMAVANLIEAYPKVTKTRSETVDDSRSILDSSRTAQLGSRGSMNSSGNIQPENVESSLSTKPKKIKPLTHPIRSTSIDSSVAKPQVEKVSHLNLKKQRKPYDVFKSDPLEVAVIMSLCTSLYHPHFSRPPPPPPRPCQNNCGSYRCPPCQRPRRSIHSGTSGFIPPDLLDVNHAKIRHVDYTGQDYRAKDYRPQEYEGKDLRVHPEQMVSYDYDQTSWVPDRCLGPQHFSSNDRNPHPSIPDDRSEPSGERSPKPWVSENKNYNINDNTWRENGVGGGVQNIIYQTPITEGFLTQQQQPQPSARGSIHSTTTETGRTTAKTNSKFDKCRSDSSSFGSRLSSPLRTDPQSAPHSSNPHSSSLFESVKTEDDVNGGRHPPVQMNTKTEGGKRSSKSPIVTMKPGGKFSISFRPVFQGRLDLLRRYLNSVCGKEVPSLTLRRRLDSTSHLTNRETRALETRAGDVTKNTEKGLPCVGQHNEVKHVEYRGASSNQMRRENSIRATVKESYDTTSMTYSTKRDRLFTDSTSSNPGCTSSFDHSVDSTRMQSDHFTEQNSSVQQASRTVNSCQVCSGVWYSRDMNEFGRRQKDGSVYRRGALCRKHQKLESHPNLPFTSDFEGRWKNDVPQLNMGAAHAERVAHEISGGLIEYNDPSHLGINFGTLSNQHTARMKDDLFGPSHLSGSSHNDRNERNERNDRNERNERNDRNDRNDWGSVNSRSPKFVSQEKVQFDSLHNIDLSEWLQSKEGMMKGDLELGQSATLEALRLQALRLGSQQDQSNLLEQINLIRQAKASLSNEIKQSNSVEPSFVIKPYNNNNNNSNVVNISSNSETSGEFVGRPRASTEQGYPRLEQTFAQTDRKKTDQKNHVRNDQKQSEQFQGTSALHNEASYRPTDTEPNGALFDHAHCIQRSVLNTDGGELDDEQLGGVDNGTGNPIAPVLALRVEGIPVVVPSNLLVNSALRSPRYPGLLQFCKSLIQAQVDGLSAMKDNQSGRRDHFTSNSINSNSAGFNNSHSRDIRNRRVLHQNNSGNFNHCRTDTNWERHKARPEQPCPAFSENAIPFRHSLRSPDVPRNSPPPPVHTPPTCTPPPSCSMISNSHNYHHSKKSVAQVFLLSR